MVPLGGAPGVLLLATSLTSSLEAKAYQRLVVYFPESRRRLTPNGRGRDSLGESFEGRV